jgi:hypothetical protein
MAHWDESPFDMDAVDAKLLLAQLAQPQRPAAADGAEFITAQPKHKKAKVNELVGQDGQHQFVEGANDARSEEALAALSNSWSINMPRQDRIKLVLKCTYYFSRFFSTSIFVANFAVSEFLEKLSQFVFDHHSLYHPLKSDSSKLTCMFHTLGLSCKIPAAA